MSNLSEVMALIERQGEDFRKQFQRLDALEQAVQGALAKANRPALFGGGDSSEDREYKQAFDAFLRKGVLSPGLELKAMSSDSSVDGGYSVPKQLDGQIYSLLKRVSPIRAIARVVAVETADYHILVNKGAFGASWVGERAARPQTTTPQFADVNPPSGDLYAFPMITQRLLDDSALDLETWIVRELADQFAVTEGTAFVAGDGIEKPRGIITYPTATTADATRAFGTLQYVASGAAGAFAASNPSDALIKLVYAVAPRYRAGATWVLNSNTLEVIRKFKDGQGNYLWQPSTQAGEPSMLLGYPVVEAVDMPDVAANSLSIAFGNFQRGYVITDRFGTRMLRDALTNKPYVGFYAWRRTGGSLVDSNAIKLMKFAAS